MSYYLIPTPESIIIVFNINELYKNNIIFINPFFVYLRALLIKFHNICLYLILSVMIYSGTYLEISIIISIFLYYAYLLKIFITMRTI